MSRKTNIATAAALLDQLVTGPMTPGAIEDVMRGFKKALITVARRC